MPLDRRRGLHDRGRGEHPEADGVRAELQSRVRAGAYSTAAGTTDAITLFDRAADGTLTRRATPTAKDGCIAWTSGPRSAGSCRTARAIGLIKAWTISPDGKQLYAAGDQRGIAVLDRDTTTGLLSERAVPNGCITETGRATSPARRPLGSAAVATRCARSPISP